MFNRLVFTVAFVLLIVALAPAAGSASYKISAWVMDAGGSGASTSGNINRLGGAGAPGVVIIWEFK